MIMPQNSRNGRIGRDRLMACLLVVCMLVVAFWEIMANMAQRSFEPFELTAADFLDFDPRFAGLTFRRIDMPPSPTEPNILAYELHHVNQPSDSSVLVRLVHGYNMPDCMRIKGYTVELISDSARPPGIAQGMTTEHPLVRHSPKGDDGTSNIQHLEPRTQTWRLTSDTGHVSIWTTCMIHQSDFSGTDVDICSMAFPRIGIPDDPDWLPQGFTLRSMQHPFRNLRRFFRAKWNNSRCDIAAFLRLKPAAWADNRLLTLVAATSGVSTTPDHEANAVRQILMAQNLILSELREWRRSRKNASPQPADS